MLVTTELWQKGTPIDEVVDCYTFMAKQFGLDNYRYFHVGCLRIEHLDAVPDHVRSFITGHKRVLGIANLLGSEVVSIVFRDLEKKDFCTFVGIKGYCYGIGKQENFSYGDPLIVVEGLKDRDCLAQVSPNTVAICGSSMSQLVREVLLTITNNFILFYDQDETGKLQILRDKKSLEKRGATVGLGKHPAGVKDCGEIIDVFYGGDSFQYSFLKSYYHNQLEVLGALKTC